jgi:hypothetical protein
VRGGITSGTKLIKRSPFIAPLFANQRGYVRLQPDRGEFIKWRIRELALAIPFGKLLTGNLPILPNEFIRTSPLFAKQRGDVRLQPDRGEFINWRIRELALAIPFGKLITGNLPKLPNEFIRASPLFAKQRGDVRLQPDRGEFLCRGIAFGDYELPVYCYSG